MQQRPNLTYPFFRRVIALVLFGVLALHSTPLLPSALAAPLSGPALESPIARFILGETLEGAQLISRILGRPVGTSSLGEFATQMKRPEFTETRLQLEERLGHLRESFHEAEVSHNGGKETSETSRFSEEERAILRAAAEHELALDPSWHPLDPQAERIRFLNDERFDSLATASERFVGVPEESSEEIATPAEEASPAQQERAKRNLIDWYKESQACIRSRPPGENRSMEIKNIGQQLMIAGAVTTVGTVVRTGVSKFELPAFSVDLLMSLISTGVSMAWMSSTDTFMVRWAKVHSWGNARAPLDAEIYRINPWVDTHGTSLSQAAAEREANNVAWNYRTSWVSPVVFTLLNGAECLTKGGIAAEGTRIAKGIATASKYSFWIKSTVSVNSSILFYRYRSAHTSNRQ